MTKHTLSIFRLFFNRLPPYFPDNIARQIEKSILDLENDKNVAVEIVEDSMIQFGYDFWPWNKAYNEIYKELEESIGQQFFVSHLPDRLKNNFLKYTDYGLNWSDMYSGQAARYFDSEDISSLISVLIKTKKELMRLVKREITGLSKKKYLLQVDKHKEVLLDMKKILKELRFIASSQKSYHPDLTMEIEDRVRHFEFGLCLLGPVCKFSDVEQSVDFFNERKKHLNLLRGINKPIRIDFLYN